MMYFIFVVADASHDIEQIITTCEKKGYSMQMLIKFDFC